MNKSFKANIFPNCYFTHDYFCKGRHLCHCRKICKKTQCGKRKKNRKISIERAV